MPSPGRSPLAPITFGSGDNGPAGSANGGLACGAFAVRHREGSVLAGDDVLGGNDVVAVTLHRPPPLDSAIDARRVGRRTIYTDHDDIIATASPSGHQAPIGTPLPLAVAARAEPSFPGYGDHPFPTCLVCGTDRPTSGPMRGMHLKPGPVDGQPSIVACTWSPEPVTPASTAGDNTVAEPLIWAALDCPGGWTLDLVRSPRVVARMRAQIFAQVHVGERYVVIGRLLHDDEARGEVATELWTADGDLVARASATWLPWRVGTSGRPDRMS